MDHSRWPVNFWARQFSTLPPLFPTRIILYPAVFSIIGGIRLKSIHPCIAVHSCSFLLLIVKNMERRREKKRYSSPLSNSNLYTSCHLCNFWSWLFLAIFFCKRYKSDNRAPFVNRELFHPVTDLSQRNRTRFARNKLLPNEIDKRTCFPLREKMCGCGVLYFIKFNE